MKRKNFSGQPKDEDHLESQSVSQSRHTKRPRRDAPTIPSAQKSTGRIKRELRDVTRVLEHSHNLPADVRIEKERAAAGYRLDLDKAETERRKQQMIKKYHMVRFFERQKATRRLKGLKKLLPNAERGSAEHAELDGKVHRAEVDLNYTLYCPLDQKYTSLYKGTTTSTGSNNTMVDSSNISQASQSDGPRPVMWAVIEQCMADNTLEALREGRLQVRLPGVPHQSPRAPASSNPRLNQKKSRKGTTKHSKTIQAEDQAAESDGGFFEES